MAQKKSRKSQKATPQKRKLPKLRITKRLLESALTHPSYRYEHRVKSLENFDRMEFFGDSILNYVICRKLYRLFPKANEGELSRLRSTLVSRKILCRVFRDEGFHRIVKLGKSLLSQVNLHKAKVMADVYEALIAAVYFDRGLPSAERFILKHFKTYFDAKRLLRLDPNPKSFLQELCQKNWKKLPLYSSSQNHRGIKTQIFITHRMKSVAYGKTRRIAEENAARLLIRKIRKFYPRSKKASSGKKLRKVR